MILFFRSQRLTVKKDTPIFLLNINVDAGKNWGIQKKIYKTAKNLAAKRSDGLYQMQNFEAECKRIKDKHEQDRTLKEIAMLKQYENENWREQFDSFYDYDDDENYGF